MKKRPIVVRDRLLWVLAIGLASCFSRFDASAPESGKARNQFKAGTDLVLVDVSVTDSRGNQIPNLRSDDFEVLIDRRKHVVVSVEFVGAEVAAALPLSRGGSIPLDSPPRHEPQDLSPVIVLAIDGLSFNGTETPGIILAAREFISKLPSTTPVGLFAYPLGPKREPSTNRASLLWDLQSVTGQSDGGPPSQFHLRPADIVDITSESAAGQSGSLAATIARECGRPPEPGCPQRLQLEVAGTAQYYEGQAALSLGMLRSLLESMARLAGPKTLVLVSAGLLASDAPGGRPDLHEAGIELGKLAARSNASIYVLFIDSGFLQRNRAEERGRVKNLTSLARDSGLTSRWLEQFAGAAGGALFRVSTANPEAAFEQLVRETSAYYLLGVPAQDQERDGRAHEISVRVRDRKLIVRHRKWVMIPAR